MCCGSLIRRLVFLWATTVAPPAWSGALLSVWSKCQCVLITNFTGAPNDVSDSWSLGQAGATNVSTMINPSAPCSTTTLPPGPESRVRCSPSCWAWIGTAPICARNAARRSGCWDRTQRGIALSAAIVCKNSRRVLVIVLTLLASEKERNEGDYVHDRSAVCFT